MNALTLARAGRSAALGIWLGSGILFFLAAQIVFSKLSGDRTKAGEIVGSIIHTMSLMSLILGAVAICAQLVLHTRAPEISGVRRYVPLVSLIAAMALLLFLTFYLTPVIEGLRDKIGVFDASTESMPERAQFRKLHGASMGLSLLEMILVAAALIAALL
jgi:uncharacterized membrane protein